MFLPFIYRQTKNGIRDEIPCFSFRLFFFPFVLLFGSFCFRLQCRFFAPGEQRRRTNPFARCSSFILLERKLFSSAAFRIVMPPLVIFFLRYFPILEQSRCMIPFAQCCVKASGSVIFGCIHAQENLAFVLTHL